MPFFASEILIDEYLTQNNLPHYWDTDLSMEYTDWLLSHNFSPLVYAWMEVAASHASVYAPLAIFWAFFHFRGWMVTPMIFWIEHVVSNLNWIMHISSLAIMAAAFSLD